MRGPARLRRLQGPRGQARAHGRADPHLAHHRLAPTAGRRSSAVTIAQLDAAWKAGRRAPRRPSRATPCWSRWASTRSTSSYEGEGVRPAGLRRRRRRGDRRGLGGDVHRADPRPGDRARARAATSARCPPEWHRTAEVLKARPGAASPRRSPRTRRASSRSSTAPRRSPATPAPRSAPSTPSASRATRSSACPTFDDEDCIACEQCVAVCPGLAITLVDFRKGPRRGRGHDPLRVPATRSRRATRSRCSTRGAGARATSRS